MLGLALFLLALYFAVINPILAAREMQCPVCYDPIAQEEEVAVPTEGKWAGKSLHIGCAEEVEGE